MNYKTLKDLPDIAGVPVLVRLDLNVPIQNNRVTDDYRIRKALPTINFLREKGAKVIAVSHIEGEIDTLKPVFESLKKEIPVTFCEDCLESGADTIAAMKNGEVMLCENIRLYDGEKKNDEAFSKKLASLATFYINDAFSVSHRKHASVVGVPKFLPGFLGLQFEEEIKNLSVCFNPEHPFVFVLGGAKFDTKLPLVNKFLPIADAIIIGGALANDLYKARGMEVGVSLVADAAVDLSAYVHNEKIVLPADVVVETSSKEKNIRTADGVGKDEKICDAGPQSLKDFKNIITKAKTILWNGPFGNFENGYKEATLEIAKMIASTKAVTIIGGGDTLAAIAELNIENKFTFVSTGGGAMLDFLANGTLPGLEALKK